MGATTFTDLRAALHAQLQTLADIPAVAWPNRAFNPDITAIWLRPRLLMARSRAAGVGIDAMNYQQGIFQVSIFAPKDNGDGSVLALANSLIQLFKRGTLLSYGSVSTVMMLPGYIGPMLEEPDWFHLPVSLPFYAYTDN